MSKEFLIETFDKISGGSYAWMLYFFKIDRRSRNPYTVYKIRFKNGSYLKDYSSRLVSMIQKYQISKIDNVKDYTGENSKVSCDKIEINNELIKEQWDYLFQDVCDSLDDKISGKYNGYIITGQPADEALDTITLVKMANPVINLANNKSAVFRYTENDELESLTDEVCRLYLDADFVVLKDMLYTFNYKFEDMFNMEKTMKKIKSKAIDKIIETDAVEDVEQFCNLVKSYSSPRTFITLNSERIDKIKDKNARRDVASLLKISVDSNDKMEIKTGEEASRLIKYLCFKIFQDKETDNLLEAANVSKVNI